MTYTYSRSTRDQIVFALEDAEKQIDNTIRSMHLYPTGLDGVLVQVRKALSMIDEEDNA